MREALSTGRINLADFYAKRARRILPAATIVLLVTFILTLWFLPQIRWESIGIEIISAAFYVVNWVLAANTDYLNAEVAASPLQHFWTLAVEEQFYIAWPLILIAALLIARRRAKKDISDNKKFVLRYARVGVLLLLLPSLGWSVFYTATSPAPAYFVTTTRLWELAIGAALAIFVTQAERIPDFIGHILGWCGLVAIALACVLYSESTVFPGSAALLPTLGAAAVIVGGLNGRATRGAGMLLSWKPARWIGDISYSLYLWHWPLIVVGTYILGGELRFRYGILIVILAVLPAWLSYRFIEDPFRRSVRLKESIKATLLAGGNLMLVSALIGAVTIVLPGLNATDDLETKNTPLGAEALMVNPDTGIPTDEIESGFIPSALDAREDIPVVYENGCHVESDESGFRSCVFGDLESETDLVLVGDSHAAHWAPAMIKLAERNGWRLEIFTRSACGFADVEMVGPGSTEYPKCTQWNEEVLDEIIKSSPDLVITSNSSIRRVWDSRPLSAGASADLFSDGLHRAWERLNSSEIPVVAIRDTPRMDIDVPECVSANASQLTECSVPRRQAVDTQPKPDLEAAAGLSRTGVIDANGWICPEESCSPIIGNVLVWRDGHHLTETFSKTLATPVEELLGENEVSADVLFARGD